MLPEAWTVDDPDFGKKIDKEMGEGVVTEAKTAETLGIAELKSLQDELESLRVVAG